MTAAGGSRTRTVTSPLPLDLRFTVGVLKEGQRDLTIHGDFTASSGRAGGRSQWWRCWHSPEGPVTAHYRQVDATTVDVEAWGPGADWALEAAPGAVGALDSLDGFDPTLHPKVERAHRRNPALRIGRSGLVADSLVPTIFGQKVTGVQAHRAWHLLVRRHGHEAPGPQDRPMGRRTWPLRLPPTMDEIGRMPYWAFHPLGVEQRRAEVVIRAARRIDRLQEAADMDREHALRRLTAIPGLGPWTANVVLRQNLGDPDAVEVGDYHLKDMVAYTLAGEPRATDERMMELLAPFAPHRGRTLMLLKVGGSGKPRRGPRMSIHAVEDL